MTNKKYYSILIIDKDKEFILIRYLFLERVVTFKRQESMGLFRTEEEKQAIVVERKELEERITNSPMTQIIIAHIMEKFGNLDAEEIQILRELRQCDVLGGYKLIVQKDGVIFNLLSKGQSLGNWGISFDAMGYEDLSKECAKMVW